LDGRQLTETAPFQVAGNPVDPAGLRVTVGGNEARLEARVMLVLVYLAEHAGRVVSRAELEEKLWPGRVVTEDSVTKAIAKLRRVFRDDARNSKIIETLPKSGYRLIAQVTRPGNETEQTAAFSKRKPEIKERKQGPRLTWIAGIGSVVLLLLGFWITIWWDRIDSPLSLPRPAKPALAVIPFGNLGRAPEDDYFANGITADLTTDLSRLNGLVVIASRTAFAYRNSQAELGEISAELDVDYLVTGSVQRLNDDLRINVQLIETRGKLALWGERYSGDVNDIFDIQDQLTASVITALQVELAPEDQAHLAARPTASVAAYDAYLRGVEEHGRRSEAQNNSARRHFEEAVALDPGFARAYTGLALTYSREAIDGWTSTPRRSLGLANRFATEATAIDPSLPQVHFVTGQIRLFQRRHSQAIESAERAIEIDPNYADAYALLAWTLNYAGLTEEASSALEMAMQLNPRPPASYLEILGEIHFTQEKYEDSAATFQSVLKINPGYLRARLWSSSAHALAGLKDQAEWDVGEALVASPNLSIARLKFAFPFKNSRTLGIVLRSLRDAGLPDR
jgi:TolB-like protein/DNA-binding winged helix-turn-helix (wHTH) protein/Tfp pilus assembly protein PilF